MQLISTFAVLGEPFVAGTEPPKRRMVEVKYRLQSQPTQQGRSKVVCVCVFSFKQK